MIPSIDELKGQCRIDPDDDSEDSLITVYGEAALEKAEKYLNRQLFEDAIPPGVTNGLVINSSVKLAIMLAVAHWYANREATTVNSLTEVPLGFFSLLADYRLIPGT